MIPFDLKYFLTVVLGTYQGSTSPIRTLLFVLRFYGVIECIFIVSWFLTAFGLIFKFIYQVIKYLNLILFKFNVYNAYIFWFNKKQMNKFVAKLLPQINHKHLLDMYINPHYTKLHTHVHRYINSVFCLI